LAIRALFPVCRSVGLASPFIASALLPQENEAKLQ
jgi:hypothetical protein